MHKSKTFVTKCDKQECGEAVYYTPFKMFSKPNEPQDLTSVRVVHLKCCENHLRPYVFPNVFKEVI